MKRSDQKREGERDKPRPPQSLATLRLRAAARAMLLDPRRPPNICIILVSPGETGEVNNEARVIWTPDGKTFTREPDESFDAFEDRVIDSLPLPSVTGGVNVVLFRQKDSCA